MRLSKIAHVDDDFVKMLFQIIEQVSDDVDDPYHYPTIRVLVSEVDGLISNQLTVSSSSLMSSSWSPHTIPRAVSPAYL